ncbi:JmjC domain-containing protein [Streptomyces sp. NPDC057654]|uniref:JmjC domain-containing protein n=1 Tax=Streptomyces sp. NPDC057654 TaxID=3346196 RepID=UPI0036A2891F
MDDRTHLAAAFGFAARLGTALLPHYGGLSLAQLRHAPQVFAAPQVEALPLPLADQRSPRQTVALMDRTGFYRDADEEAVKHAYDQRARTRVYESINVRSDGWYSLAALHLARLVRRRVICTMYESHAGDRTLGKHDDGWDGVIVQMRGAKQWQVWPHADDDPHPVLTQAGDVLLLPRGIPHDVSTPSRPGYSVHLVFAITDEPLTATRPAITTAPPHEQPTTVC